MERPPTRFTSERRSNAGRLQMDSIFTREAHLKTTVALLAARILCSLAILDEFGYHHGDVRLRIGCQL
jgi:hypothetical protein